MSRHDKDDKSLDLDGVETKEKGNENYIVAGHELSVRDVSEIFASLPEVEKLEDEISERSQRSFTRYDEFSSFASRSSRKMASCDVALLTEYEKRTVKVPLSDSPEALEGRLTFYEQEPISKAEALDYYMQPEDFMRCDTDVKTNIVLWLKSKKGQGEFDEELNTIRGLEELFDSMKHHNDGRGRNCAKKQHVKLVMAEVDRHLLNHKKLDAEKIRQVSLESSEAASRRANFMGERDAAEAKAFHGMNPQPKMPLPMTLPPVPLPDSSATSMAGRRGLLGVALPAAKVNENKSRKKLGLLGFLQRRPSDKT